MNVELREGKISKNINLNVGDIVYSSNTESYYILIQDLGDDAKLKDWYHFRNLANGYGMMGSKTISEWNRYLENCNGYKIFPSSEYKIVIEKLEV